MSWEQIRSACSGGKPPAGMTTRSLEEAIAWKRDMRENWRKYHGV